jgi:hypothetical protein
MSTEIESTVHETLAVTVDAAAINNDDDDERASK